MNDAEFEVYSKRFLLGLQLGSGGRYRARDFGEMESVEMLAAIEEIRHLKALTAILNGQLVLNAVIFTDAATISEAEVGVQPEILSNVFRLAVAVNVWTGK